MIARYLLAAYLWLALMPLWLGWALIQTAAGGRMRHDLMYLGSPDDEPPSMGNCFGWAIWRFIRAGGVVVISTSPRVPVWRCSWAREYGAELWHFEPRHPKRGVAGIWHTFWHAGRPRVVSSPRKSSGRE